MNKKNKVTIMSYIVAALVVGSILSFAGNADASLSLDYTLDSSNGPQASIYYDPADLCLHGSNIAVTKITGIDTTQTNQNSLDISGGLLNFVTDKLTGTAGNTWTFKPGGLITVTGSVAPNASTTLLSGAFDSISVMEFPNYTGGAAFDIFGAKFSGTGSQSIYNLFNMPSVSSGSDGINLSFIATSGTIMNNNPNSNIVASGNILDTPISPLGGDPAPTPIPAAAWLLGSGLLGLAGLRSRRLAII